MKISLTFKDCGTKIPYFDPAENKPEDRHEYVDLRVEPQKVDELPEMQKAPELKDFLLSLNAAGTIFRTFGCNFTYWPGVTTHKEADGPDGVEETQTTADIADSYLHLGFADLGRCTVADDYYRLIGRLAKHLYSQEQFAEDGEGNDNFAMELGVEPLAMNGEEKGYLLAITCDGIGWSEGESRARWVSMMSEVVTFLAAEKLE